MHEVIGAAGHKRALISDFVSSADVNSTTGLTATATSFNPGKAAQYGERVMKKIMAKQIIDKRDLNHVHTNSR